MYMAVYLALFYLLLATCITLKYFIYMQVDMPQLRTHMICEIIDQKLFQ